LPTFFGGMPVDSSARAFLASLLTVVLLPVGGASASVTVTGPANVPDFTEYAYAASGCKAPTWSVSDPVGTISGGQGTQHVVIAWGAGPKAVDVDAACGKAIGHRHVKIMQVTITDPRIAKGAVEDADHTPNSKFQYARFGDKDGAPPRGVPGVKFDATVTVTGPVARSSDGPSKITVGFVQILTSIPTWKGHYAGGDTTLRATFASGPPWHDQVTNDSDPAKAWYTKHAGANFTPSPGKLTSPITTWDRPKPGWLRLNKQKKDLLEAEADWVFVTFICVETADAPKIYFNRARADWTADYKWTSPNKVGASNPSVPNQFTPLADRSQPSPITGMLVNTGIDMPNLDFVP
jgi:hypothetical protein